MYTQKKETRHLTPILYRNELKGIRDLYVISESMKMPQEVFLGGWEAVQGIEFMASGLLGRHS
jgi:hypothetical protein